MVAVRGTHRLERGAGTARGELRSSRGRGGSGGRRRGRRGSLEGHLRGKGGMSRTRGTAVERSVLVDRTFFSGKSQGVGLGYAGFDL